MLMEPKSNGFSFHINNQVDRSKERLGELLRREENETCSDCAEPEPTWASTNWGTFICTQCAGVHRSLGVEHSFVLSTALDHWTEAQVNHVAEKGNRKVNNFLEYSVPKTIEVPCLSYTDRDTREKYIRAKYVQQLFKDNGQRSARPPERVVRKPSPQSSPSNQRRMYSAMIEYLGIVNVRLLECHHLIVKDLTSSDPYCVLKLGPQTCKTTTKYKTLNPVYNENFSFSWDGLESLVVEVFDKDELTKDDHMGLIEVDLQPLLKAEGLVIADWQTIRHRKKDREQGEMKLEITFTRIK